jgi:hypothetical protein
LSLELIRQIVDVLGHTAEVRVIVFRDEGDPHAFLRSTDAGAEGKKMAIVNCGRRGQIPGSASGRRPVWPEREPDGPFCPVRWPWAE